MSTQTEWANRFAFEIEVLMGERILSVLDILETLAVCGLEFVEADGINASLEYQSAVASATDAGHAPDERKVAGNGAPPEDTSETGV